MKNINISIVQLEQILTSAKEKPLQYLDVWIKLRIFALKAF